MDTCQIPHSCTLRTLHTAQCTMHTSNKTLNTAHYILHTAVQDTSALYFVPSCRNQFTVYNVCATHTNTLQYICIDALRVQQSPNLPKPGEKKIGLLIMRTQLHSWKTQFGKRMDVCVRRNLFLFSRRFWRFQEYLRLHENPPTEPRPSHIWGVGVSRQASWLAHQLGASLTKFAMQPIFFFYSKH